MTDATAGWGVISATRIGASHRRHGMPNQDAAASLVDTEGRWVVAAVADGHGSRRCLRSDRGSRFATDLAVNVLQAYAGDGWNISEVRRDAEAELAQRLVLCWRDRVDGDLASFPLAEADLDPLNLSDRKSVEIDPRLAYGTTVVAAMITQRFGVFLQLGDGDVLVLPDDGEAPWRPLPSDPRSFANETASFAASRSGSSARPGERGPWADVRVRVVPASACVPGCILLTTDGYPNAFAGDAEFMKASASLRRIGREHGWDYVREELGGWLEEASEKGSGDDVTVTLLVRLPATEQETASGAVDETVQTQPEGG